MLLIFPNTFEYFFIFYEAYRLRWDPLRMSRKVVLGTVALIWIVIKLPQEYWIHISQIDTTDWIKTNLFGVPADTSWRVIFNTWPGICLGVLLLIGVLLFIIWKQLKVRIRPADRALAFSADAHQPAFTSEQVRQAVAIDGQNALLHMLMGRVQLARREYRSALAESEIAVRLNPTLAPAFCGLGDALSYEGRNDEAIVHLVQLAGDLPGLARGTGLAIDAVPIEIDPFLDLDVVAQPLVEIAHQILPGIVPIAID